MKSLYDNDVSTDLEPSGPPQRAVSCPYGIIRLSSPEWIFMERKWDTISGFYRCLLAAVE